jgi:hypothetical protein
MDFPNIYRTFYSTIEPDLHFWYDMLAYYLHQL